MSSLGVYDTFFGLSANQSQESPSLLFDWTRVLAGCVSVAVGTLVWNKLEQIDKMRQTFFSRLGKQLDEIQLLVKSDKSFAPLPQMEPVGDLSPDVRPVIGYRS